MKNFSNGLLISSKGLGFSLLIPILVIIPAFFDGNAPKTYFIIATGIMLIWSIIIFRFKGILIDFQNKKIKIYSTFLFFKLGSFRNLTDFPFYKVKKYVKSESYATRGTEGTYSTKKKGIFIYDKKNRKELLLTNKIESIDLENLINQLNDNGLMKK